MINKRPITWQGVGISALKGAITGVAFGAVGKAISGSMSATTRLTNYSRRAIQAQITVRTVAKVGTNFGKIGKLVSNNPRHVINWNKTTIHGVKRIAQRGVTKRMANNWVKTGKALQQSGGQILYVTRQGAVCVNKAGQVITAYTNKYFDSNIKKIVGQLFGR